MIANTKPKGINLGGVFAGFDPSSKYKVYLISEVVVNDIEDILNREKFEAVTEVLDLSPF